MEQVVEVPVVQTLRDTEGELIQESHWVSRWKGYISTYRRQKVGLCALQLYVAVIHTYGRWCPHHLFKWCCVNASVRNKHGRCCTRCLWHGAYCQHMARIPLSTDTAFIQMVSDLVLIITHTAVCSKSFPLCNVKITWYKALLSINRLVMWDRVSQKESALFNVQREGAQYSKRASFWLFAGDASHRTLGEDTWSTFVSCKWVCNTRVRSTFVWVKDCMLMK